MDANKNKKKSISRRGAEDTEKKKAREGWLLFFRCVGANCVSPLTLPSLICGERFPEKTIAN